MYSDHSKYSGKYCELSSIVVVLCAVNILGCSVIAACSVNEQDIRHFRESFNLLH